MSNHEPEAQPADQSVHAEALIVSLEQLARSLLLVVGGKAAQLGELIRARFSVPADFCITTTAYAQISAAAGLDALLA